MFHGFTQSSRTWGRFAQVLAKRHQVEPLDLPGHGAAARARAGVADYLSSIWPEIVARGSGPIHLLGYSLGARFALEAAFAFGSTLSSLVLISPTAGIENEGERLARRQRDELLASRIATLAEETDRAAAVRQFLRQWLAQPLFAGLSYDDSLLEQRVVDACPSGWAHSLRSAGLGSFHPRWNDLETLATRTLVVAGELDTNYCRLADRMGTRLQRAEVQYVTGAGHAPHLQHPETVARLVEDFISA
jgi:2-succinyl-6-hydroxy-2,4-cyclohexadiene-1-carboxylate synthase